MNETPKSPSLPKPLPGGGVEKRHLPIVQDHFAVSYAVWTAIGALPILLGHDLDRIFNLYLMLGPVMLVPALATVSWLIISLLHCLRRGKWRQGASVAAAPLFAVGFFYTLSAAGISTDTIRFILTKSFYAEQVAALPATSGEPKIIAFPWGETGGAGVVNIIETLVFDESAEIAKPSFERSAAWSERLNRMCPGTIVCSIAQPHESNSMQMTDFGDHFYLFREIYQ